jgi:DNA-binding NarL/FixJ family response regulator
MPRKNGIQCLEEIRSVNAFKNLPVIIYSTTANASQIETSFIKGASLYLQKPSHFEGIKKSIIKILSTGITPLFEQPSKANFFLSVK